MPAGIYKRHPINKNCIECSKVFTLHRAGSDKCKSCRRKIDNKKYRKGKYKPIKKDKQKRKIECAKYYSKNKEAISKKHKIYYKNNRDKILVAAEKKRRDRGEMPSGSIMSGPEVMFCNMLKDIGISFEFRKPQNKIELDFFIIEYNIVFELMGEHHRRPIRGEKRFKRTLEIDQLRRDLCKNLNYTLIEVPVYGAHRKSLREKTICEMQNALSYLLSKIEFKINKDNK